MSNSINTNIAAYYAQANITAASNAASSSVARLSSGNRIVQASDDVAALATGTSLASQVSALKTAQSSAAQGSSLLQVADGSLAQIQSILQQQQSIAQQALAGSLTDTDRGFLNQQFQALSSQIDSLAGSTSFNGVNLLDGSLSQSAAVTSNTTAATAGNMNINFTDNVATGETVLVNGVSMIAGGTGTTGFAVGNSLSATLTNLATALNTLSSNPSYSGALGAAGYSASNQTLNIAARSGGTLSNAFTVSSVAPSVAVASGSVATTNASASVVVTVANSYQVGQSVILSGLTTAGVGGVSAQNLQGIITAASATGFTFTAGAAATSTATSGAATAVTANTATYTSSATGSSEAGINGGLGNSSFDLFATTTGFSSATTAISADTASSTTTAAFQNGDSITAQVNGVTKTLYTFGTASDGGARTLTDVVNGINANAGTTGIGASLDYQQSSGTYNIRLNYNSLAGNVLINTGSHYNSTIYGLNGASIATAGGATLVGLIGGQANGAGTGNNTLVYTGYTDLLSTTNGITVANTTTSIIGTTAPAPFHVGDNVTININGNTQVLHTFAAGDTLTTTVADINSKTASTGVYAALTGTAANYGIRLFTSEAAPATDLVTVSPGGNISVLTGNTATQAVTTGASITQNNTFALAGGADNGLGQGSVSVSGTVGDSILQTLGQNKAAVSVILTQNPVAGDNITIGGQKFTFTANTTGAPNEILIGSTLQTTLNNAVSQINAYQSNGFALGNTAYQLNQLNVTTNGNSLVFTGKGLDNVTKLDGTTASIAQSITGASITNSGNLNNASSTYGLDTTGISNAAFQGTLQGFTATYKNTANTVDLSIKIGDNTYTAQNVNASVSTDTPVRFYSDTVNGVNGGYFDVQLKGGQVQAFSSQAGADGVATRLNAAFSSLSFKQTQNISSYTGSQSISADGTVIGSLYGSKVSAQLASQTGNKISNVTVTAPTGSNTDAQIALTINGVQFTTASGIGSTLGANQTYKLVSANDPSQFVNFTTGSSTINLSSADNAKALQSALVTAFGADAGSAALSFQVGASASNTIAVSIGSATTSSLFEGETLDVSTAADAAIANAAVSKALDSVTSLRAGVGASESQFTFASAALQSSVQNEDAARGQLLDTDIAAESTNYANEQVKLQAGISVLAQANQSLQALLKLIQ